MIKMSPAGWNPKKIAAEPIKMSACPQTFGGVEWSQEMLLSSFSSSKNAGPVGRVGGGREGIPAALCGGYMRDAMPSAKPAAGIKLLIPVCLICELSNILSSRIGACAVLARACARTVWLTMVFAQAHHTTTIIQPLRQSCAVLARSFARAGLLTNYVTFGFR